MNEANKVTLKATLLSLPNTMPLLVYYDDKEPLRHPADSRPPSKELPNTNSD